MAARKHTYLHEELRMTWSAQLEELLRSAASDSCSDGEFSESVLVPDGRRLHYQYSFSSGMAWLNKQAQYLARFENLPCWVRLIHPSHRVKVCSIALEDLRALPVSISNRSMKQYSDAYVCGQANSYGRNTGRFNKVLMEKPMPQADTQEPFTEFDVEGSGTLKMADFWEPQTRAEFYESIADSWSESPLHLSEAMAECQPLAWAVQVIYSKVRDELQFDLDTVDRSSI